MKTMWPPGYHDNGFMATHALEHMMYGYTLLIPMNQRVINKLSNNLSTLINKLNTLVSRTSLMTTNTTLLILHYFLILVLEKNV